MQPFEIIRGKLRSIDGADYGAYQALRGEYEYPDFSLIITRIPKDPYAPPHTGVYRVLVKHEYLGIPVGLFEGAVAAVAYRDYLARRFSVAAQEVSRPGRGTGHSGLITLDTPAQAILDRSAAVLVDGGAEIRFFMGLPAEGRTVNAGLAQTMLLQELPEIVGRSLRSLDPEKVRTHIEAAEDAEFLRSRLDDLGLSAFIADGSVLPRKSGTSDKPLDPKEAVPFRSTETLCVSVDLPHAGTITGMGIPRGVTLIVGGGYHGKSTLLHAIKTGVYDHIPGDGRERCATDPLAVKVRAYSGRSVASVGISRFIDNLPFGKDTADFSTPNASGSTSQAASIVEALETGARVLLMDEDTCAANFMIRDRKIQDLVRKEDEPITPFIDRVRALYEERGVSSIIVSGGLGDYFDVADTVIQMVRYSPRNVTAQAKKIARSSPARRKKERLSPSKPAARRLVFTGSIDPLNQYGKKSVYAKEPDRIHFGKTAVDLTDVEPIAELSQTRAIAQALVYLSGLDTGPLPMQELVDLVMKTIDDKGLDGLSDTLSGHLARFRPIDLARALNRLRTLRVQQE